MCRIALSSSNWVVQNCSGHCLFADRYHCSLVFVVGRLVCLLVPSLFVHILLFHLSSIPFWAHAVSSSWHRCVTNSPKSLVLPDKAASAQVPAELSFLTAAGQCLEMCTAQGMTICWPGQGPSVSVLGKLACTLSGNFHYLPTGQHDFAIDRGFIMSAILFFENMDKTVRERW